MFEFNDAYIGVVAGGMSDADTLSLFQDAFGEMGVEVAKRLRRVDGDLVLEWDSEGPFVYLTEDQFLAEFGDLESPASYRISQAFIHSSHDASKAFEEVVQG